MTPYCNALIGEGLARSGRVQEGMNLVGEALDQIGRPGWEERVCQAEVLRLQGEIYVQQGNLDQAEQLYRMSLHVSRQQEAKSWELRGATSFARLLQRRGRQEEARKVLGSVLAWFREGFDTRDVRQATELLADLAG